LNKNNGASDKETVNSYEDLNTEIKKKDENPFMRKDEF